MKWLDKKRELTRKRPQLFIYFIKVTIAGLLIYHFLIL